MTATPENYLDVCSVIDHRHPAVREIAAELAASDADVRLTAERCFTFVRDEIRHSSDYRRNPVTCVASDVLKHRTGYCYAKSHLLCALLRANNIPAGMCYQRLTIQDEAAPHCLHGLNAIFLPNTGWYRVDARGNRDHIRAQFCPPREELAFNTSHPGEIDFPGIHITPLPVVVSCLTKFNTWDEVYKNLPDAVTF